MRSALSSTFVIGVALLSVWAASGASRASAAAFIVEDGTPRAAIVIAENPTRMQELAAEQLREYVRKISGATLPIGSTPDAGMPVTIYVGRSAHTEALGLKTDDLENGVYRIKSGDDWLALIGKDTDYFMDKPGGAGSEFAARNSDFQRAVDAWREKNGPQWSHAADKHWYYNRELDVWTTDDHGSLNAVNDFLRSLGVRWYMPGEFGEVCPAHKSIALPRIDQTVRSEWEQREMIFWRNRPHQTTADNVLWQLRLGMHVDPKVWGIHGTDNLIEHEWVKENHPEYYALYGGKRETRDKGKPCYSSRGLFESAVGFSRMMFDEYGKDVVTLTPSDAFSAICQCDLCRGKDTPERGLRGLLSDYVWDFMNRVAAEIAKTHPDKHIRCHAYGSYRKPPLNIEAFHPNLKVSICQGRKGFHNPDVREEFMNIREAYIEKLPSGRLGLFEYYSSRDGIPRYYPHMVAEDMQALRGHIEGTYIEVSGGEIARRREGPDPALATRHLHLWLTGRLWWGPDPADLWWTDAQNVDDMLDEYCAKFFGPAADEMRTFIDYTEKKWPLTRSKPEVIDRIYELITAARQAAGSEGLYAERVQLVIDYMEPLRTIREQLKVGRSGNPVAVFDEVDQDKITLDGRIDEAFWATIPAYELKHIVTGEKMDNGTTFKVVWSEDSLYFAIRCEEPDMDKLTVPAQASGDLTLFDGDSIEILLETPSHAYYQIAIDPEGHVNDLDRPNSIFIGKTGKYRTIWDAGATVATHRGETFWSVEARIPALGADQEKILPDFGVSGDKPTKDMPWHFNVCRSRKVEMEKRQFSTFSPTGEHGFHYMRGFARLEPQ